MVNVICASSVLSSGYFMGNHDLPIYNYNAAEFGVAVIPVMCAAEDRSDRGYLLRIVGHQASPRMRDDHCY